MARVLVACEYSGVVREAFRARGHEAWSCDLLPTDQGGYHFQCDVREVLKDGWDVLIAHPPCTHLAVSGARYFKGKEREQEEALEFVRLLMNEPIRFICVENPISVISTRIRKPEQIIQPWMFGHPEAKATCLWLKNLPPLQPTDILTKPANGRWLNQTPTGQNAIPPTVKDRWKVRSKTYQNVGTAMAEQWGDYVMQQLARNNNGAKEA